jgi:NAD(P)-dependent dehydrogenase (short-subunit alcohol dehydrogenase family)
MGSPLGGRTALVTGGGKGIGEAIARVLAGAGAKVVVTGRDDSAIGRVAAELDGRALRADLADRRSTDDLIEAIGRTADFNTIDILVNNAGIAMSAPLASVSDADWDRTLEINLTASFRLARAFVPAMVERGWGRLINVASNAGVSGYRYTAAYCASKHGMVGLTRALAVDLGPTGVTANAICPGWVDTEMGNAAVERIADKTGRSLREAREALEKMSPQRRFISAGEVAEVALVLCGEGGRGINGQALVIDGGAILK